MTPLSIAFLPLTSPLVLATLAFVIIGVHGWDIIKRRRGSVLRALAGALLILTLSGPQIREQDKQALPDRVAIVVDRSASMMRTDPQHGADQIVADMVRHIRALGMQTDISEVADGVSGTPLSAGIRHAISRTPPEQLAGVLVITDGLGHDLTTPLTAPAPIHGLIVGDPRAFDLRPVIRRAPRTAQVGSRAKIEVALEGNTGETAFTVYVNDTLLGAFSALGETPQVLTVPITRRMAYDVRVETAVPAGDLNPKNNQTHVTITGIHDRLRVLLVTGTPYPGVRAWRNLLTSDPMVDLVHFTILRTPAHEDFTPADDLSLIAFPTHALFSDALKSFDLVIFDRYRQTGVLSPQYLDNIAKRVKAGGALLTISGPEDAADTDAFSRFAGLPRLSDGPLGSVMPVTPDALVEGETLPRLSSTGRMHPVTSPFSGENWGPWMRYIRGHVRTGTPVMQTPSGDPLLVLAHVGQGRVASIMSDQAWVWARDYKGGGPYGPLMRRLIHWLMDEPDLDENRLSAQMAGPDLIITRHSLSPITSPVTVTKPDGTIQALAMAPNQAGVASARMPMPEPGIYRLTQDDLKASITVTARQSIEDNDGAASLDRLRAVLVPRQGFVTWAGDIKDVRAVQSWAPHHGRNWLGVTPRHASKTTYDHQKPVSPAILLAVVLCLWLAAWWREGR